MSIELVMPSSPLILCHPLLLLPPIFSSISVFSNESVLCIRLLKYWSFSFSISPSNEYSGLVSFKIKWSDVLAVQGALKSFLQYHSSKESILPCSDFFTVQFPHPYMTPGKTIALTRWTLVGKVMSLLFNMLPRLAVAFLPRSKCLLISWLQSPSAMTLEPPKIKHYCFGIWGEDLSCSSWDLPGQRRNPSKMVGGTKSFLESSPILIRNVQQAQTKSCVHQETPQKLSQTCLSVSPVEVRVSSGLTYGRGSGCSRLGYGMSALGGGHH